MRKMAAYILIAITLLSNGMVDFAINICHGSENYAYEKQIHLMQKVNDSKSTNDFQTKTNNLGFDIRKTDRSKNTALPKKCCSDKTSSQPENLQKTEGVAIREGLTFLNHIYRLIVSSETNSCCVENSFEAVDCCTHLNLYYFTPKFIEEIEIYKPISTWKCIITPDLDVISILHRSAEKRGSRKVDRLTKSSYLNEEGYSPKYCVWII